MSGRSYKWKDGVAVAVLDMFVNGRFSSDPAQPHRVDCKDLFWFAFDTIPKRNSKINFFSSFFLLLHEIAETLLNLDKDTIFEGLQVGPSNQLPGLEERVDALINLGTVLQNRSDYFGNGVQRPGNLMGKYTK
jgi:hypothetical protein